jgi:hypothetical protein
MALSLPEILHRNPSPTTGLEAHGYSGFKDAPATAARF